MVVTARRYLVQFILWMFTNEDYRTFRPNRRLGAWLAGVGSIAAFIIIHWQTNLPGLLLSLGCMLIAFVGIFVGYFD